jgi:Uma2 family endonuclease
MVTQLKSPQKPDVIYPDSDGKPMSDNTKQFRWILIIQQNLAWLFADDPNVFVAGDLLWYPVEENNKIKVGPDVMVAFGRPKGDRGSYQQWLEENIAPQVVFEIFSPSNRFTEMNQKQAFYDRYGVEEYYLYDPQRNDFSGWMRSEGRLDVIEPIENWVSPRLGIRFDLSGEELQIYRPDGEPFASYEEVSRRLEQAEQRAEQAEQRAEQAEQRAALLAERLREMGINPEQL